MVNPNRRLFLFLFILTLGIPTGAYLVTRYMTKPGCTVGTSDECGSGKACARLDGRGRTLCVPVLPAPPFELGAPFAAGVSMHCVRGPRTPDTIHADLTSLEALRLSPSEKLPLQAVHAGVDGTAYIFTGCKEGDRDCAWGFGNYVQIIDSTQRYTVLYSSLSSVRVKNGYPVKKGDVIGVEGTTGRETQRGLSWQVNAIDDTRITPDIAEKPAWRTRSVPFRFQGQDQVSCAAGSSSRG